MATTLTHQQTSPPAAQPLERLPATIRPHPNLLKYFLLSAFRAGPGFPVLMLVLYFRYHTLRYEVDEEGITMRWGILFRREVSLTYARIQDIHLVSNVIERWLGLARIQVQTASGSSNAEMTIEGLSYYQAMRDFLYARMRGARAHGYASHAIEATTAQSPGPDELTAALNDIAVELRALRAAITARSSEPR